MCVCVCVKCNLSLLWSVAFNLLMGYSYSMQCREGCSLIPRLSPRMHTIIDDLCTRKESGTKVINYCVRVGGEPEYEARKVVAILVWLQEWVWLTRSSST